MPRTSPAIMTKGLSRVAELYWELLIFYILCLLSSCGADAASAGHWFEVTDAPG